MTNQYWLATYPDLIEGIEQDGITEFNEDNGKYFLTMFENEYDAAVMVAVFDGKRLVGFQEADINGRKYDMPAYVTFTEAICVEVDVNKLVEEGLATVTETEMFDVPAYIITTDSPLIKSENIISKAIVSINDKRIPGIQETFIK
jgi:hypothetical protein